MCDFYHSHLAKDEWLYVSINEKIWGCPAINLNNIVEIVASAGVMAGKSTPPAPTAYPLNHTLWNYSTREILIYAAKKS